MSLNRVSKALDAATRAYDIGAFRKSFTHSLECMQVMPHQSSMSEAEFPPAIICQRFKLEALVNELLGNLYHRNSCADGSLFESMNASSCDAMRLLAVKSWQVCITLCEHYPTERELQQCHLCVIPDFVSLSEQLRRMSAPETVRHITAHYPNA